MAETSEVGEVRGPLPNVEQLVGQALLHNGGGRAWRHLKKTYLSSLVQLAGGTEAMDLLDVNLEGDFQAVYVLKAPVPRHPRDGQLQLADEAVFHLRYEENWRFEAIPGWAPLGLLYPTDPYHPNMKPSLRGAICLGTLPAGTPPSEIVIAGYFAVTLQSVTLDETDPEGVLNREACDYFRRHAEYLPLTRAGFGDPAGFEPWS